MCLLIGRIERLSPWQLPSIHPSLPCVPPFYTIRIFPLLDLKCTCTTTYHNYVVILLGTDSKPTVSFIAVQMPPGWFRSRPDGITVILQSRQSQLMWLQSHPSSRLRCKAVLLKPLADTVGRLATCQAGFTTIRPDTKPACQVLSHWASFKAVGWLYNRPGYKSVKYYRIVINALTYWLPWYTCYMYMYHFLSFNPLCLCLSCWLHVLSFCTL